MRESFLAISANLLRSLRPKAFTAEFAKESRRAR